MRELKKSPSIHQIRKLSSLIEEKINYVCDDIEKNQNILLLNEKNANNKNERQPKKMMNRVNSENNEKLDKIIGSITIELGNKKVFS